MKKLQSRRILRIEPLEKKLVLSSGPLVISEFMAKNETTILDSDGDYCDWIEIHNPTDTAINLQGWSLTDDATELDKWTFPDVTIDADEYLLVFASDKDRTDPNAELHTNFKITTSGEYLGLIQPDGTVAFDYAPSFPVQYEDISYGGSPGQYFLTPTPGAENGAGSVVDTGIVFSHDSGVFFDPFQLTLTTDLPDAVIRYTLDGSEPTTASPIYSTPIAISSSETVYAKVFSPVLPDGGVLAYESYVQLDSSLSDWSSNLPVIILDADQISPNQDDYIDTAAAFFEPAADGLTNLSDSPVLNSLSGIKIRGSSSASFPKKQYSFEIRDAMGEDFDVSIFGLPEESDWVLYAPYSDKSLMRNYLAYNWSDAMGHYAPGTVFCEVFLNTDDGVVEASDYVGVYVLIEKIKIGENRVDIEEINGGSLLDPTTTGGVILKVDRQDSDEYGFVSSYGQSFVVHKPDLDELSAAEKLYIRNYINDFEAVLYGDDFADPEIGYAAYIDVESFIDEHILVELMKNIDGFRLSNYFYFDDDTKLTSGPVWDYNLSLGNANYYGGEDPTGWYYQVLAGTGDTFNDYPFYDRLFEDPNFQQQYIDRWAELRSTIFDTETLLNQINETATYLNDAEIRDQAVWQTLGTYVWPNYYIGQTYADEINYMSNFLTQRLAWIDSQFLVAPVYSEESGQVESGTTVMLTVPDATGSTIYYTTDGTDPRLSGGEVSSVSQAVSDLQTSTFPVFTLGSTWRYNDTGTDLGTAWRESGYDCSSWSLGQGEFGYGDGDETTIVSYGSDASNKYPTTYFVKTFDITDPTSVQSLNIDLIRDDGAVVYLNGQEVIRSNMSTGTIGYDTWTSVCNDDGATTYNFSIDPSFLLEGTNTIAVEVHQANATSSDLNFDLALSVTETTAAPITINETTHIVARTYCNGEWSAPTEATYEVLTNYLPGDANLDGRVDGSDVTILAGNWQFGVDGNGTATWAMGDFNGDGKVDGSDVTILAANWQAGVDSSVVAVSSTETSRTSRFVPPSNVLLGVATVPKQSSLSPRRLISSTSEATDTVLAESTWSSNDMTSIAKDLVASTKKSTKTTDNFFALNIDLYTND